MPSFKQKNAFKNFRSRILSKVKSVSEETNSITAALQAYLVKFEKRISEVLESDDEHFYPLYKKLNRDLENYHDKLIFLQEKIEALDDDASSTENKSDFQDCSSELGTTAGNSNRHSFSSTSSFHSGKSQAIDGKCILNELIKYPSSAYETSPETCDVHNENVNLVRNSTPESNSDGANEFHLSEQNLKLQKQPVNPFCTLKEHPHNLFSGNACTKLVDAQEEEAYAVCPDNNNFNVINFDKNSYLESNSELIDEKTQILNSSIYRQDIICDNYVSQNTHFTDPIDLQDDELNLRNTSNVNVNPLDIYEREPFERLNIKQQPVNFSSSIQEIGSDNSFSQSSCYRSLSSNLSDIGTVQVGTGLETEDFKDASLTSPSKKNISISPYPVCFPAIPVSPLEVTDKFNATLTHVIDPSNFWLQIENTQGCVKFPLSEHIAKYPPPDVKKGSSYLVPFKNASFYYRAQALNNASKGDDKVRVFFLDHGSMHEVRFKDVRPLPWAARDLPIQSYHCYLFGISPLGSKWSSEAISKFEELGNYCLEAIVKARTGYMYGVQLIAKTSAELSEDYSSDIGLILQLGNFAGQSEEIYTSVETKTCKDFEAFRISKEKIDESSLSSKHLKFCNADKTAGSDSGVSLTSNFRSSHPSQETEFCPSTLPCSTSKNSTSMQSPLNIKGVHLEDNIVFQNDLISFESCEKIENSKTINLKLEPTSQWRNESECRTTNLKFALDAKVPVPALSLINESFMIVMLSSIVSPSDFHVNLAMENCASLDELQEQMTLFYKKLPRSANPIEIDELSENMFCACPYDQDEFWYRAKILHFSSQVSGKVLVQFVDYGNKTDINACDVWPLTDEFAKHPAFAIQCSLAEIVPVKTQRTIMEQNEEWDKCAVKEFKELTSFDRPLTAQIRNLSDLNSGPLQVRLWDTTGSEDILINNVLVEKGFAETDKYMCAFEQNEVESSKEIELLNRWDPMSEQYNDIDNSYGVPIEDIQVATTGYSLNDDEHTCKYFSLRGYCPRSNCPYEHVELAESGITRDQEETYSFDNMPLIPEDECDILIEVLVVKSPGHFYAVLPFGNRTVDEIDSIMLRGGSYEELYDKETRALHLALSSHYSSAPFDENTTIALACGNIVAAKSNVDNQWYRGRIIDVKDVTGPAKVFFIDFGNEEWINRKSIRKILPHFLHTPFQAIQCSLSDVEPKDFKGGKFWSKDANNAFEDLVSSSILLAHVNYRCGNILHVTLKKTLENDRRNISDVLVMEGYAQYCKNISSRKKETLYVPG